MDGKEVMIIPDWTKRNYFITAAGSRRRAVVSRELGSKKWSITVARIHKGVIREAKVVDVTTSKEQLLLAAMMYAAQGNKTIDEFISRMNGMQKDMKKLAHCLMELASSVKTEVH